MEADPQPAVTVPRQNALFLEARLQPVRIHARDADARTVTIALARRRGDDPATAETVVQIAGQGLDVFPYRRSIECGQILECAREDVQAEMRRVSSRESQCIGAQRYPAPPLRAITGNRVPPCARRRPRGAATAIPIGCRNACRAQHPFVARAEGEVGDRSWN